MGTPAFVGRSRLHDEFDILSSSNCACSTHLVSPSHCGPDWTIWLPFLGRGFSAETQHHCARGAFLSTFLIEAALAPCVLTGWLTLLRGHSWALRPGARTETFTQVDFDPNLWLDVEHIGVWKMGISQLAKWCWQGSREVAVKFFNSF